MKKIDKNIAELNNKNFRSLINMTLDGEIGLFHPLAQLFQQFSTIDNSFIHKQKE